MICEVVLGGAWVLFFDFGRFHCVTGHIHFAVVVARRLNPKICCNLFVLLKTGLERIGVRRRRFHYLTLLIHRGKNLQVCLGLLNLSPNPNPGECFLSLKVEAKVWVKSV